MHITGKKLCVILHRRLLYNIDNAVRTLNYTVLTVTWCCSECCVSSGLDFKATNGSVCTLLFVQLFASITLSRCKCDMGTLSWLNAETLERAPTPLLGRLVRCSAHGQSFARLHYLISAPSHTPIHTVIRTPPLKILAINVVMLQIQTAYLVLQIHTCLGPKQLLDHIQVATLTGCHQSSPSFPLHMRDRKVNCNRLYRNVQLVFHVTTTIHSTAWCHHLP